MLLSGFDGVRREIARLTLERLLVDGRIHPARIEEAYHHAKSEIDKHVVEIGEQAVFEANVGSLHPELVKLLGRLRFRTSYGQNVCATRSSARGWRRCSPRSSGRTAVRPPGPRSCTTSARPSRHETEGPHALVGGELARRWKETEAVAHAMEAHHNEVEPQTVEAVIVQVVDALSGARPGARGESLEHYVKRLHELEAIAGRHEGVEKVYAMQAGREIRVIVQPECGRRRRGGAAVARDRARRGEGARVPGPDQGHGDPGEPRARRLRSLTRRMKSYHVTTFGCQMNEHDSERMKGMLESLGYAEAEERERADLILFNTCSIRRRRTAAWPGTSARRSASRRRIPAAWSEWAAAGRSR